MGAGLVGLSLLGLGAAVATWPREQQGVFRASTNLLTVDATVLGSDGQPIPSLTADDFEVRVNGLLRPVRTVVFLTGGRESTGVSRTERASRQVDVKSVLQASNLGVDEPRLFVILFDDLLLQPGAGKGLIEAARRFVTTLPRADLVGVSSISGSVAVNPTTNRQAVLEGIRKLVGAFLDLRRIHPGPFVGISEALEIQEGSRAVLGEVIARECFGGDSSQVIRLGVEQVKAMSLCASQVDRKARTVATLARRTTIDQLGGLEATMMAMGTARGIKHLILITGGLGVGREFDQLRAVARAASAAGVQLSVLAEEVEDIDLSERSSSQGRRKDDRALLQGVRTMTDISGGSFYRVIGTPERFMRRIDAAASGTYRLGIDVPEDMKDTTDIAVTVAVRRAGASVFASHRAAIQEPVAHGTAEQRLDAALRSNSQRTGVPIEIGSAVRRGTERDSLELNVDARIRADVPGPVEGAFVLFRGDGTQVKAGRWRMREPRVTGDDRRIAFALSIPSGQFTFRLAALDGSGVLGSIAIEMTARLARAGPYEMSDLYTARVEAAPPTRYLLIAMPAPQTLRQLEASVEIYAAPDAPVPSVTFRMSSASSGITRSLAAQLEPISGGWRAGALFDVTNTPAGAHEIEAELSANSRQLSILRTTFAK